MDKLEQATINDVKLHVRNRIIIGIVLQILTIIGLILLNKNIIISVYLFIGGAIGIYFLINAILIHINHVKTGLIDCFVAKGFGITRTIIKTHENNYKSNSKTKSAKPKKNTSKKRKKPKKTLITMNVIGFLALISLGIYNSIASAIEYMIPDANDTVVIVYHVLSIILAIIICVVAYHIFYKNRKEKFMDPSETFDSYVEEDLVDKNMYNNANARNSYENSPYQSTETKSSSTKRKVKKKQEDDEDPFKTFYDK